MTESGESARKTTILAVDDTSDNLMQLYRLLNDSYQIRALLPTRPFVGDGSRRRLPKPASEVDA